MLAGHGLIHQCAGLPARELLWLALVGAVACACTAWPIAPGHPRARICLAAAGLLAGVGNAGLQAHARLADALAPEHHDQVSRLVVRVVALAHDEPGMRRFLAEAEPGRPAGIPARLRITWHGRPGQDDRLPEVLPGQRWRMALILRRPYGPANPHAWDAEQRDFAEGVRAVATVRGQPRLLEDRPWSRADTAIERVRHHVRAGMRRALDGMRYGPVLIALAIGDQAGVAREDWEVFNRTGITHLVSISGMHVTLVAAMGGMAVALAWRRARWRGAGLAERLPAQVAGGAAALTVALGYCLLAGWGVPARRTFFMLAVVAAAAFSRLPLGPSRILLLAGACVVLLDPWAVLAPGFWLSFGAVAILMRVAAAPRPARGWRARAMAAVRGFVLVQGAITLALAPLLAYLVRQLSLASPFANALAIPIVGAVVTPLALLCAALAVVPGADTLAHAAGWTAHALFQAVMMPVAALGRAGWAVVDLAAAPWPLLALALAGVVSALQGRGWPGRHLGWFFVLPLLCWRPDRPEHGDWRLAALDVGQGSAVVLETARHVLLYDTGPRRYSGEDAGEQVVAPYLRSRGIRAIDVLVVSHADLDHAGGLRSVLAAFEVGRLHASFDVSAHLDREARLRPDGWLQAPVVPADVQACHAGGSWEMDGVRLRFVHPPADAGSGAADADDNARSCVLLVEGRAHRALLPGDAGTAEEGRYVAGLPRADVVLAPHHGSATSSGPALVEAAGASHVLIQAGHLNRFRHPAAAVVRRWEASGARVWRTDRDGAVVAWSSPEGLALQGWRDAARRYWHAPGPQP